MTFISKLLVAISDLVDRRKEAIPVCHVPSSRAGKDVSHCLKAQLVESSGARQESCPCYAYLPAGVCNLTTGLAD